MCDEAGGCHGVKLPDAVGNFRGVCPSKSGEPGCALRNGIVFLSPASNLVLTLLGTCGLNPEKFGGMMTHPEACLAPHTNYYSF